MDEVDVFCKHAAIGNDIGRVAGHEETFQIRAESLHTFLQFPSVHSRHDHIGDKQCNLAVIFLGQPDRLERRLCGNHANFGAPAKKQPAAFRRLTGARLSRKFLQ